MLTELLLTASIAIDQVGYPANAPKIAIVTSHAQSFEVLRNDEIVLRGPVNDSTADFSRVTTPGAYTLVAGDERVTVNISDDPYASLLQMTMRAYTGQRCGTAVDIGDGYKHPACHLDSPVKGGWHDAGDYGRYVVNSGISTGTLLWACELFEAGFRVIPSRVDGEESRTSMATHELDSSPSGRLGMTKQDMLDEIRWNVDWMLGMQDKDGSVWVKETSKEFPPFIAPQDDHSPQLLIGKSSCAAGDFAAVMAIAARTYHDTKYSTAADRAWRWLQSHPNMTFRNPPGVKTGEYGDRDCSDERMWAAAEIWRTAHDKEALAYLQSHRFKVGVPDWQHVGSLAAWSYAMTSDASDIRARTIAMANDIVQRTRTDAYRIPLRTRDYVWGSNAVAANNAVLLLIANRFQPNHAYIDTAYEILHYLLGRNPFSMSFVTGTGTNSVQHPHHRPSATDNIAAPWPGLLAGGPNRNRQDPVLKKMPRDTPPMLMYRDDQESYASNEVAINWNAPLVFVLAGLRSHP